MYRRTTRYPMYGSAQSPFGFSPLGPGAFHLPGDKITTHYNGYGGGGLGPMSRWSNDMRRQRVFQNPWQQSPQPQVQQQPQAQWSSQGWSAPQPVKQSAPTKPASPYGEPFDDNELYRRTGTFVPENRSHQGEKRWVQTADGRIMHAPTDPSASPAFSGARQPEWVRQLQQSQQQEYDQWQQSRQQQAYQPNAMKTDPQAYNATPVTSRSNGFLQQGGGQQPPGFVQPQGSGQSGSAQQVPWPFSNWSAPSEQQQQQQQQTGFFGGAPPQGSPGSWGGMGTSAQAGFQQQGFNAQPAQQQGYPGYWGGGAQLSWHQGQQPQDASGRTLYQPSSK